MECYRRAMISDQTFEGRRENLGQANKLSRTYTTLLEALNRHRGKGNQKVTVEHVTVNSGGQAIVGAVAHPGGGSQPKSEDQPHALGYAPGTPLPSAIEADRKTVPVTGNERQGGLPDARREIARSPEGEQERSEAWPLQPRGHRGKAPSSCAAAAGS